MKKKTTQNEKKKKEKKKVAQQQESEQVIIAIGASAGGLEAIKAFFDHVPSSCYYSFVIVQHLSPNFKSLMSEILAKNTSLPIHVIENDMRVEKGSIYLLPPNTNLSLHKGKLLLIPKPDDSNLNLPIDIFFKSLATELAEKAIVIILSGTGSDGTSGARMVKEAGGVVMVQDPMQAKFDSMPRNAMQMGIVDYILPAEELASELFRFVEHPRSPSSFEYQIEQDKETLNRILYILKDTTDFDFSHHKLPTLIRRIARRISVNQLESPKNYLDFLFKNSEEVEILTKEFLIGVTAFFRDKEVWDYLIQKTIPEIVKGKSNGDLIKLWHVGCSTGEEPYSMAMAFLEEIEKQGKRLEVKIFATDVAKEALRKASQGSYSKSVVANVSPYLLIKYFKKDKDSYTVNEELRRSIIFSKHDILSTPPFNKMDVTVCRNLLIYYDASAQKKIINVLHYSLKINGTLVLGNSENLGEHKDYFAEEDRKLRVYKNITTTQSIRGIPIGHKTKYNNYAIGINAPKSNRFSKTPEIINEILSEEIGIASVIVNEQFDILDASGKFKKFIDLPEKGFSTNLLNMFPANVSIKVSSTTKKAFKTNTRMVCKSFSYKKKGETVLFDLIINPLLTESKDLARRCALVFVPLTVAKSTTKTVENTNEIDHELFAELEEELQETRVNLQTLVHEIESNNEQLQTTNEELLTTNEELQSTNEELQSVNEELHSVNAELLQKNEDLSSLNADIDNLLTSTRIATIFLDKDMRIRKFTPSVVEHFNLRNTDINRPIDHFSNTFSSKMELESVVKMVLETATPFQQEVQSKQGDWFLERITPYENSHAIIDGVVISFIDINEQKNAQKEFYYKNKAFEQLLEGNMAGFWDRLIHENIEYLSPSLKEMFGYQDHEMPNTTDAWQNIVYEEDLDIVFEAYNKHVASKGKTPYEYTVRYYHKDGSLVWIYARGKVIEWDKNGLPIRMVGCNVDITPIKTIEQELYRSNRDLEQFAYVASHDLQEPLNTITNFIDLLERDYGKDIGEEGHTYLQFINHAADRMGNLIQGVLGYARIGQSTEKGPIDCNQVVKSLMVDLHKKIEDTNTVITFDKLPLVIGYHIELNSLFQNLITNSIKFRSKTLSPKISIKANKEGNFWKFAFKDNGIGIDEKHKEKVFNIFQRLNNMDSYVGTGIGLAQCKKIVELHGGKIWLESTLGKGTTFYFTIKINN